MSSFKTPEYEGKDFWKNYMTRWFGDELIKKWESSVKIERIESNGRQINLEVYSHQDLSAPVIVFSHGIAGYARVLLPFIIPLYEKGYNCVVPDLQGFGYNEGEKGDFEWNAHVTNFVDTVKFARSRFSGKVIIGGASMGGPLSYCASALVSDLIDGLVCWCLWDFSDRDFMLNETATGKFTYLLLPFLRLFSRIIGNIKVKTYKFVSYDTLTGSDEFNMLIKQDPQAGTHISLKGVLSLLLQSRPSIDFKEYQKPVLVVQPGNDRMTPKSYIRKSYEKLGSEMKKYVELEECEHFPTEKRFYSLWTKEVDSFIRKIKVK